MNRVSLEGNVFIHGSQVIMGKAPLAKMESMALFGNGVIEGSPHA